MFHWLQVSFVHFYNLMSYDLILKYIIQPKESRILLVLLFSSNRHDLVVVGHLLRWDQMQDRQASPISVSPFFIIAKQSIFIFSDSLLKY